MLSTHGTTSATRACDARASEAFTMPAARQAPTGEHQTAADFEHEPCVLPSRTRICVCSARTRPGGAHARLAHDPIANTLQKKRPSSLTRQHCCTLTVTQGPTLCTTQQTRSRTPSRPWATAKTRRLARSVTEALGEGGGFAKVHALLAHQSV